MIMSDDLGTKIWESADAFPCGVSPDGHWLCVGDFAGPNLALLDPEAGVSKPLTTTGSWTEGYPAFWNTAFSPDWYEMAVAWLRMDQSSWDVRIISIEDAEARVVLHHDPEWISVVPMAWSPNGNELAAIAQRNDRTDHLLSISPDDGSIREVKSFDSRRPRTAHFSPDGRFIAYEVRREIFMLRWDDDDSRPLRLEHQGHLLCWTDSGIVFRTGRSGAAEVLQVPISDGETHGTPVLVGEQPIASVLAVTEQGDVCYSLISHNTDVLVADLDLSAGTLEHPAAVAPASVDSSFVWSADGSSLLALQDEAVGAELELVVLSANGDVERAVRVNSLVRFGGHALQPHWSPDGRSMLVQGRNEEGAQGIFLVDVETGECTPIALADRDAFLEWPVWCSDGSVIFTRWAPWTNVVVARDPEKGTEVVLYEASPPKALNHLSVSPDGRQLALIAWDPTAGHLGLYVMRTEPSEPRHLIDLPSQALTNYEQPLVQLAWASDSNNIVYPTSTGGSLGLFVISTDGGKPRSLGQAMEGTLPFGISIQPGERRLALVAGVPITTQVWKRANFFLPA